MDSASLGDLLLLWIYELAELELVENGGLTSGIKSTHHVCVYTSLCRQRDGKKPGGGRNPGERHPHVCFT